MYKKNKIRLSKINTNVIDNKTKFKVKLNAKASVENKLYNSFNYIVIVRYSNKLE